MEFFDYANPLQVHEGDLPHWRQHGVPYFVTFRLADSIPAHKLREWRFQRANWFRHHREPYTEAELGEFHFLFSERVQTWLDAGHGSCVLRSPQVAEIVQAAMAHFQGVRYDLDERVVMPNHVHVLVIPRRGHLLERILQSWKSFTAHEVNKLVGRSGQLWQHESYDHLVRSEKQLLALRLYIRENPQRQ